MRSKHRSSGVIRGRLAMGVCLCAAMLGGCRGTVYDGAPPSGTAGSGGGRATATGSGGTTGVVGDVAAVCAQAAGVLKVGRSPLRRMTRTQFNNTVRDLLAISGSPASAITPDEHIGPFFSNAIAPITDLVVQQYAEVAARLAADATPRMGTIAPCDLAADTGTSCATRFVTEFGLKAYRRPLETVERDKYLALYSMERALGTAASAFALVVETMLESPFFLYHVDLAGGAAPSSTPVPLSPYQLASRLSYFLWDSMPDQPLFAAAANQSIMDPAVLGTQVERMLADPRAADAIPAFHLQWLGIGELDNVEKDPLRFPQFSPALVDAMRAETASFSDFVVRRGDGLMSTLLTAGFSFPQGPLFQLYGLTQPAGFQPGTQVPSKPAERAGILTQAAFLATHAHRDQTSPVHRGIFVRENILCQPLMPPPANVNTTPPAVTDATTTRARFAAHEADPICAGCHTLIDPIGLAFENYDAIGAYRTQDGINPVDASGEVKGGTGSLAGPFEGAIELARKLAGSPEAANCLTNQWFRFALGRMESNDDACSLQSIRTGFATSGGNVRQLLTRLVQADAFRYVRATQ